MRVYAHRGSSTLWPENTPMAFARACEHGAFGFETDLRLSADGQIVLLHDATLARVGDPAVVVAERTADELVQAEVRSADGTLVDRAMTLEELLRTHPDKAYIFDCKIDHEALFTTLHALLERLGFHDRIRFLTWSRAGEEHALRHFPLAPRFPGMRRSRLWGLASAVRIGRLFEPEHGLLSLPPYHRGVPVIHRAQIADIHARGKSFMGYLVNSEKDIARARACGVREVLSDRCDLVARLCR